MVRVCAYCGLDRPRGGDPSCPGCGAGETKVLDAQDEFPENVEVDEGFSLLDALVDVGLFAVLALFLWVLLDIGTGVWDKKMEIEKESSSIAGTIKVLGPTPSPSPSPLPSTQACTNFLSERCVGDIIEECGEPGQYPNYTWHPHKDCSLFQQTCSSDPRDNGGYFGKVSCATARRGR